MLSNTIMEIGQLRVFSAPAYISSIKLHIFTGNRFTEYHLLYVNSCKCMLETKRTKTVYFAYNVDFLPKSHQDLVFIALEATL